MLFVQARNRLDEAFRVASLPGLPPNAQLLVRCLDLGSIRVDQSSTLLAGRISELMRNLAAAAVCVDCQSAAKADVVWFSDPLQPYRGLLARLLDGNGLHEWYWHTLFSKGPLVLSSATIEMVLLSAITTPLRGLALARLLQDVLEPRRLARLFIFVTEALACRLLREQGVSLEGAGNSPSYPGTPTHSRDAGEMRMIAAPNMSQGWRNGLQQAVQCWGEQDVRTLWYAWQALIFHQPAYQERSDALQRIAPGTWLSSWSSTTGDAGESTLEVVTGVESDTQLVVQFKHDSPSLPERTSLSQKPPAAALRPAVTDAQHNRLSSSAEQLLQQVLPLPHDGTVASFSKQYTSEGASPATPPAKNEALGIDSGKNKSCSVDSAQDTTHGGDSAENETHDDSSVHGAVALFSPNAGFAFVVPLMQRLGMAELLAGNEILIAIDFPRRLLWALAQRFGLAESDPLQQLFAGVEPVDDFTITRLCIPDNWWRLVTASGRPLKGMGGEAAIDLNQLIITVQQLAALYLRRYCDLSLRTLVQRPGRVVITATHWDTIFDLNQIDLRLRRIALDSDPGWLAWLGRVVQFHYDRERQQYV